MPRTRAPLGWPAAGGRWVVVAPERLERWVAGFEQRHGASAVQTAQDMLHLEAPDGARASFQVPFPPWSPTDEPLITLARHALRRRRVGVLLARLGGSACGVFDGPDLTASKVTTRQVHGRSAAGGQSQQRFARRREGQVRVATQAFADTAARVLVPAAGQLDAVVLGGDRATLDAVLADRRLAPLRALVTGRVLDGPDPRQAVLEASYEQFRAVWIRVDEPR